MLGERIFLSHSSFSSISRFFFYFLREKKGKIVNERKGIWKIKDSQANRILFISFFYFSLCFICNMNSILLRLVFSSSIHLEVASDSFCFLINCPWLLVFILSYFLSRGFSLFLALLFFLCSKDELGSSGNHSIFSLSFSFPNHFSLQTSCWFHRLMAWQKRNVENGK